MSRAAALPFLRSAGCSPARLGLHPRAPSSQGKQGSAPRLPRHRLPRRSSPCFSPAFASDTNRGSLERRFSITSCSSVSEDVQCGSSKSTEMGLTARRCSAPSFRRDFLKHLMQVQELTQQSMHRVKSPSSLCVNNANPFLNFLGVVS